MTPGTYCVPRNRQEWEAILRLADSLELLWKPFDELVLGENAFQDSQFIFMTTDYMIRPLKIGESMDGPGLLPGIFIAALYEEANSRNPRHSRFKARHMRAAGGTESEPLFAKQAPGDPDQAEFLTDKMKPFSDAGGTELHNGTWMPFANPRNMQVLWERLENLEGAFGLHLQEHRELLERIASNEERSDRDHFRIDYCEPRNRIVDELGFNPDSMTGPAHRTKTITPSKKLILTFSPEYVSADYANGATIVIDPKASPTNIPFEIALAYLKDWRQVSRMGKDVVISKADGIYLDSDDYLATDWMVLPE